MELQMTEMMDKGNNNDNDNDNNNDVQMKTYKYCHQLDSHENCLD